MARSMPVMIALPSYTFMGLFLILWMLSVLRKCGEEDTTSLAAARAGASEDGASFNSLFSIVFWSISYFGAWAFWASWRSFNFPILIHCSSGLFAGQT